MDELVKRIGEKGGSTVLLKDRVVCRGGFMLHYLLRKLLSDTSMRVILLGLSEPFAHYNRIARKQGCNLHGWRDKGRFMFVELNPEVFESPALRRCPTREKETAADSTLAGNTVANPLGVLYLNLRTVAEMMPIEVGEQTCIIIDDFSVLDVVACGCQKSVMDFLHYCKALMCGGKRCSVILLAHEDIYEEENDAHTNLELEYASDIVITLEPLSTGVAADVHGQLTIVCKAGYDFEQQSQVAPIASLQQFQFRISETTVQFFLPGQL